MNALVVNPFSSQELAVALDRLIQQPHLRQQFGVAARDKVLRQLAPSVEQQNWREVYQQVLGTSQTQTTPEMLTAGTIAM